MHPTIDPRRTVSLLARTARTSGLAAVGLVLAQSAALAQEEPTAEDENLQHVLDSIDAADSAVQLGDELYEFDEEVCLVVRSEDVGGMIEVHLDGKPLGSFDVQDDGRVNVKLNEAATVGSSLSVYGADGELALAAAVLQRTYFRGNVVEAGSYGDHEPDILDVLFLYEHVFNGAPAPAVFDHGDVDGNGVIDVVDVLNLYDHVSGGVSYYMPSADVLHDGSFTAAETYLPTTYAAYAGWGRGIHSPPKDGVGGAKAKDLDGNPKTKEWTFPCTHAFVPGFPGYSTMTTSFGPRPPHHQPTDVPSGFNSDFVFMLYCVSIVSGEPVVTRKPIGMCRWPNGRNTQVIANGKSTCTSTNPTAGHGAVGATYKFITDLATCKIEITLDSNGDGTFDTPVFSGDPSSWNGWPTGA